MLDRAKIGRSIHKEGCSRRITADGHSNRNAIQEGVSIGISDWADVKLRAHGTACAARFFHPLLVRAVPKSFRRSGGEQIGRAPGRNERRSSRAGWG